MATQETIKQMRLSENGPLRDLEDTTARAAIAMLQSALDAITNGDSTAQVIDTFNEVVAFLANTSDSSTLKGIIAGLNTSIAAKYTKPGTGIPASDLAQAVQTILNDVANKANSADVYTKSQTYDKDEVDGLVAISSGTYEQAVTRSQTDTSNFMWMLVDSIGSDTIRKPIFHVGNGVFVDMAGAVVEIGEVPNTPTFTMSDETSTPNEFPVGGGTVAISAGAGETIYYTTDGTTPTASSTEYDDTEPIQVTEETTIKAIAVNQYGSSEVASETFTIAVDHKFQFKIKLTGNNSTEYIPVTGAHSPQYTMSVDWGDESPVENYTNKVFVQKELSHTYSGSEGDEFIITLRGSAIPVLCFGWAQCYNVAALVAILENSLTCDTAFKADIDARGGFFNCSNLSAVSADALQNNTHTVVMFQGTQLSSIPDGLLSHLTKSGVALTSVSAMFNGSSITANITASQMAELKSAISSVTDFSSMFYGYQGTAAIPNDFFSDIQDGTILSVWGFTHTSGSNLTGNAAVLASVLERKMATASLSDTTKTKYALTGNGLSNKDQVDSKWK